MPPIALAAGLAAVAFFLFRKKAPTLTIEQRTAAMTRLPDLLYKIITKLGTVADRASWAAEAVSLALALGLSKTAEGIKTSKGLPNDENWPGTAMPVTKYVATYINSQKKLPAVPNKPAAKVYKDEIPVPPYEDPRQVRAHAVALEKQGKSAEAKVTHIKADTLNTLIKAAKLKQAGSTAIASVRSLFK